MYIIFIVKCDLIITNINPKDYLYRLGIKYKDNMYEGFYVFFFFIYKVNITKESKEWTQHKG